MHTTLWERAPVRFVPEATEEMPDVLNGSYVLDAGRIVMKPLVLPRRARRCEIRLETTVWSAGDPWDKSGCVFAFADGAGRAFLAHMADGLEADTTTFSGVVVEDDRAPALEWMRFITPFGVGHFSHTERAQAYKPEAVETWADSAHWTADLGTLQPWMAAADTLWVGVYIDTWTAEGYKVSVRLSMEESPLACDVAPEHSVWPLFNTTKLAHDQRPFTQLPDSALRVRFRLEHAASDAVLSFLTTGHGGHAGGDEFTRQPHHIVVDGDSVASWTPWRNDCAAFRRFNPTSGFWPSTYVYGGDTLEERVASSDLSRSNWCPGDLVVPQRIPLGGLEAGDHELTVSVPGAQPWGNEAYNFWNLAGWLETSP